MSTRETKIALSEIIQGYTPVFSSEFGDFFIKHSTSIDNADLDQYYNKYYNLALQNSVPTSEYQEKYIIDNGLWSAEKDRQIAEKKYYLKGLYTTKSKLYRENELVRINKTINETVKQIKDLESEKQDKIGWTSELYASQKTNEFFIFSSLFKDSKFLTPLFTSEQFNELENEELYKLIKLFNTHTEKFVENSLKQVAISSFFLNLFTLCDNKVMNFYGKAIVFLTLYQIDLFHYGCHYKHILSELNKNLPPDEVLKDPNKLDEWYQAYKNGTQSISQNPNSKPVGLSKKDQERLGYNNNMGSDIFQKAKKNGGKLEMNQLINEFGE